MTGVEERVKEFLRSWEKVRESDPLSDKPMRCYICDCQLQDGRFSVIDGDPCCLKCQEKLKEVV